MSPKVVCSHINLHKSAVVNAEFCTYARDTLRSCSALISGLQEPNASNTGKITIIPDRQLIYKRGLIKEPPRAAIYVSENLNVTPLPAYMDRDMSTIVWNTDNKELPLVVITSIYSHKECTDSVHPKLTALAKYTIRRKAELLILSDSNAHQRVWGNYYDDAKGDILLAFSMRFGLNILNRGALPNTYTYKQGSRQSIIDLTLCTNNLTEFISQWHVSKKISSSDHELIEFIVSIKPTFLPPKRNLKKGDWNKFQTLVEDYDYTPPKQWDLTTLNLFNESLVSDITASLDMTHPLHSRRAMVPEFSWFDEDLSNSLRVLKKAKDKYRRSPTAANEQKVKKAYDAKRTILKRNRKRDWRRFITGQDDFKQVAQFNRILNRDSLNSLGAMTDLNGNNILDPKESLNFLIEEHFPGCLDTSIQPQNSNKVFIPNDDGYETILPYITEEKVKLAINSFGDHKAAGPDGIQPIVLQRLGPKAVARLTHIFCASIKIQCTPASWGKSDVIFIPKPGKGDYSAPRSYRPISLMTFLMKVLERLILWHLNETVFIEHPLNINQHAFRKGRSCDSALTNMVEYIEHSIIHKNFGLSVFMDIKGAFDNLSTSSMIQGMEKKNFDADIIEWYKYFLNNRHICVSYKGIEIQKKLTKGTPQGGCLSPLIWNVAFDSLLDIFDCDRRVKIVGFADDAALFVEGGGIDIVHTLMQTAISQVLTWGCSSGLEFAPDKTIAVLFTHKHYDINKLPPLMLGNQEIKYSTTAKYLGVTLDHRLTWRQHVENKIVKAKRLLLKVRNCMGRYWGHRPALSSWLFRCIVRPVLTFGCMVWVKCTSQETFKKKFQSLNRLSLTSLGFVRYSTPTAGLEVITHTMPLWLHIQKEAAAAYLRTSFVRKFNDEEMHTSISSKKVGHRQFIQHYLDEYGFENATSDKLDDEIHHWNQKYLIDTTSFTTGKPELKGDYQVFTDGSKDSAGNTGSGLAIYNSIDELGTHTSFHLGKYTTVFQAEIYAILKAAETMISHPDVYHHKQIVFNTDSQAALLALQNPRVQSNLVHLTMYHLDELSTTNKVILTWIKAHVGYAGNEKADALAKLGAADTSNHAQDIPNVSVAVIRERLHECMTIQWKHDWISNQPCRQTKHFFPSLAPRLSKELMKYGRTYFSALVQLITGHNFLNRHNSIVELGEVDINLAKCSYCNDNDAEESTAHILSQCDAFAAKRLQIFGVPYFSPEEFAFKKASKLIQFLQEVNLDAFADILNYEADT